MRPITQLKQVRAHSNKKNRTIANWWSNKQKAITITPLSQKVYSSCLKEKQSLIRLVTQQKETDLSNKKIAQKIQHSLASSVGDVSPVHISRRDPCVRSMRAPRTVARRSFYGSKRSANYEDDQSNDPLRNEENEQEQEHASSRRKLRRSVCSIRESHSITGSDDTVELQGEKSSKASGDMSAVNPNESAERFSDMLRKQHELTPFMATLKRDSHVAKTKV